MFSVVKIILKSDNPSCRKSYMYRKNRNALKLWHFQLEKIFFFISEKQNKQTHRWQLTSVAETHKMLKTEIETWMILCKPDILPHT